MGLGKRQAIVLRAMVERNARLIEWEFRKPKFRVGGIPIECSRAVVDNLVAMELIQQLRYTPGTFYYSFKITPKGKEEFSKHVNRADPDENNN